MKKHADNDNAKKGLQKSQLPVSKNFYTCVTGRVSESLELIGRRDAVDATMDCIDRYMADGTVPSTEADTAVLLTFSLLRAEIDKAILRSRRARQRAADSKAATDRQFSKLAAILAASSATADMDAAADEDEAGEAAPFVPRNRRERRLYEQELRRIARRQSRKKGFAYSGDF